MGLFDRIKEGLRKTAAQLRSGWPSLSGGAELPPEALREMEDRLVTADVGAVAAKGIVDRVREGRRGLPLDAPEGPETLLREAILERLALAPAGGELPKPAVVLMVGVNGAGKTTTSGKLACYYSSQGRKVLLAAADTFRAAAEEQLTEWARRAKVGLVHGSPGAAPSSVVFDALKSGLSQGVDLFVVDTAGRLHNRSNLMEELKKVARVCEKAAPGAAQERWLVLDANTGQNGLVQAREFMREIGLTGIVMTKLDGTAKGGILVALCGELGLPIRFLGVGEGLEDLVPYDARMFAEALVPGPGA